jgi:hypothetical protein
MNTKQEIVDSLDKLNGAGLDMVHASMSGALLNCNFVKDTNQNGLILNLFLEEPRKKNRPDVFKRLDQAAPGVVKGNFPYRGGAGL